MIDITLGHSPDPDDAFMWWPITGKVDPKRPQRLLSPPVLECRGFRVRAVPLDISALNARAVQVGDLDVTAMSAHCYPYVQPRYQLTACGWSVGRGYGPKLVARPGLDPGSDSGAWRGVSVAVPGLKTTACLAFQLLLGDAAATVRLVEAPFETIPELVARGQCDVGLVIHDAQLTYQSLGLTLLQDLGLWWFETQGLPLPLGVNCVRRDLEARAGIGAPSRLSGLLRESISYALGHRAESLAYAAGFAAPATPPSIIDRFVSMYVTAETLDARPDGLAGLRRLLCLGAACGRLPPVEPDLLD